MKIALVHPAPVGCGRTIEQCDCKCSHCSLPVARCECHCGRCGSAFHTRCQCAQPHVIPAGTTVDVALYSDEYVGRSVPRPRRPNAR